MKRNLVALTVFLIILALASGIEGKKGDSQDVMGIEISDACLNKGVIIRITGRRDKPLEGVDIDIYYKNRKKAYGKTDDDGIFEFTLNNEGVHQMTAEKSGYASEDREITVYVCATTTTTTTLRTSTTTIGTTSTTVAVTTTIRILPTIPPTTLGICNRNALCEPARGENYGNCDSDCPSGRRDGYCDRVTDGICDPDCLGRYDPDCVCNNNGVCEGVENYGNCMRDCRSGGKDNYCDGIEDDRCDPDCPPEKDPDCKKVDYLESMPFILIILLVFGVLAGYGMKREMKKRREEGRTDELIDQLKDRLREGEDPDALRKELVAYGQDPELLDKAEKGIWS